jgi:hypothetical protein
MELVTISELNYQCRTSGEDALLTMYADAAEAALAKLANRNLYIDADALQAAIDAVPADMAAAHIAYDEAMDAAALIDDERDRATAESIAENALSNAQITESRTINGIAINGSIKGAILLTVAEFYRNREVGDVPQGARNIMQLHQYVGP